MSCIRKQDTGYFKITNEKENHFGFQYQDGLNVLTERFNEDVSKHCAPGGFYFTTLEHIHYFYNCGCFLREIFLPVNDPNFKMIHFNYSSGHGKKIKKWRTNMIILGNKYELCNLETIEKFNLKINNNMFEMIFKNKKFDILDWCKINSNIRYTPDNITRFMTNGDIDLLQWFKDNEYDMSYISLDGVFMNDRNDVLEWMKNNKQKIIYYWIDDALEYNKTNVLDWLKKNDYEIKNKYSGNAIDKALVNGYMNVLDWLKNNNYQITYTSDCFVKLISNHDVKGLKWVVDYEKSKGFDNNFKFNK